MLYDENSSDDEDEDDDTGYDFSRFDTSGDVKNDEAAEEKAEETSFDDNADDDEAPSYDFSRFEKHDDPVKEDAPAHDISVPEKKPEPVKAAEAIKKPEPKPKPMPKPVQSDPEPAKPVNVGEEPKTAETDEEFVPYDFAADIDLNSVNSISLDDDDDKY